MKAAIVAAAIIMSVCPAGLGAPPQELVTMLDKTGYPYSKIDNNIWEVQFKGDHLKEFPVRIIQTQDVTVLMTKLADRKDLVDKEALYLRLLELNDSMDNIKFAISKDMVYGRIEIHTRLLNESELKYLLGQMSAAIDQAYPEIQKYLGNQR